MHFYDPKLDDLYRFILEEEEELYGHEQSEKNLVKTILGNKDNFAIFINKFVNNYVNLDSNILEKVTNELDMNKDNFKEPDFIYKTKDEKVYYILEHQTVVDKEIIYRMLNYTLSLIKIIKQIKLDNNENIKLPQIIPIVFYTGKEKWDSPLKIENIQEKILKENIMLTFKYILININDYTEEELLNKRCIISYIMLLEKNRRTNKPERILEKIFESCKSKKEIEDVILLINSILVPVLGDRITSKLINKYSKFKLK